MIPRYDWWHDFEEATFDKWAEKALLNSEPPKLDDGCYDADDVFEHMEISVEMKEKARVERPVTWFALVKFPYLLERLVHLPHQVCSNVWYFFYNAQHRFDRIDLKTSWSYHDPAWRLERAVETLLVDYVDIECGLDGLVWQSECDSYNEERKAQLRTLVDAYHFFKTELPALEKQIDDLYAKNPAKVITRKERQEIFRELGGKKDLLRNKHLDNVWKYRGFMWT
jgi:hypothetical protein